MLRRMWSRSLLALLVALAADASTALAAGDPAKGAEHYRACVACHSLEPGVHLTGPSLAGLWGSRAARARDYIRYSRALLKSGIVWDEGTLASWVVRPEELVPGTYMVLPRPFRDEAARSDLLAFLALALAPGGAKEVLARKLLPGSHVEGQVPEALAPTAAGARVTAIRHCRDSYFITTADGVERPYWEMNVRLKLDTRETGPESGKPAIAGAGMMGDRISVVFRNLDELKRMVGEKC